MLLWRRGRVGRTAGSIGLLDRCQAGRPINSRILRGQAGGFCYHCFMEVRFHDDHNRAEAGYQAGR
jgi:hypothetical protein